MYLCFNPCCQDKEWLLCKEEQARSQREQQGKQDSICTDRRHSPTVSMCKKQTRSGEDDHGQPPQFSCPGRSTVTREVSSQAKVSKVNNQAQTLLQHGWGKRQRQAKCFWTQRGKSPMKLPTTLSHRAVSVVWSKVEWLHHNRAGKGSQAHGLGGWAGAPGSDSSLWLLHSFEWLK